MGVFLTSLASGREPTCRGGAGDNSILLPHLEREFEAEPLNFAFCAKKLGSWMFLLPQEGPGTQSKGSSRRRGALWLRIPSPSQGAARAEQRGGYLDCGRSVCNLRLAGKLPLPVSCSPRSPVQTFALALGQNRHLVIQYNLQNPVLVIPYQWIRRARDPMGRKGLLTLRVVFALKLLSPGSLPPTLPSIYCVQCLI